MQQQPPVVAMAELIDMLGVSKSRVVQLIAMPDFPAPVATLRVGKLWSYDDVRSWAERAGRTVHPIAAR